ncbi:MAG: diaminopimelate epimerase [Phycisphaeraceae bacterium]|nr:diaminopimelate epimerase [Phycisphaerales bacterium]QOJ16551.1 MAG: diaminopimelate epimerase [Phycisphaeraceae bacterium]
MSFRFVKMHGAANDYIYVDGFAQQREMAAYDLPALSREISHRHTGIGADGLIVIMPPDGGVDAHVRMRMFNADGSESEMCGNGIRCVAKFAHDRGLTKAKPIRVQTGAGVLSIDFTTDASDRVIAATVDMGEPILEPSRVPVDVRGASKVVNHSSDGLWSWSIDGGDAWVRTCGLDPRMTTVSMGNPHVVFYCDDAAAVPLASIGPVIEHATVFPRRVNVHFVQVHTPAEVTMRTWERGSGITQACGTGACAVCVAGVLTGRTDRELLAHLPGGDLRLRWDEGSNHVFKTGPAVTVFEGVWPR